MFTGKGDSSKLTDGEKSVWDAISRLGETGHIVVLTPDQSNILLDVERAYRDWMAVWNVARSIRNTLLMVGGLLAIYWATQDWLQNWIRSIVGA